MSQKNLKQDQAGGADDNFSLGRDFDKFIYLLSHDVRNAARAVIEIPKWIQEDMIDEGLEISDTMEENFKLLNNQANRLDKMLGDLLTYSRVGRKQKIRKVDLGDVTEHILNTLSIPDGFVVQVDLEWKDLEIGENDIIVLFTELISNSIRHHDKNTGKIHIHSHKDNENCVIIVSDDGPGIEEKHRSTVFEVMKTLRARDEVEGTGMGLATVKKIATYYGGSVRFLDQAEYGGVSLEVVLPI